MLLKHPKVADVAVIGVVSAERATELPRAYVVPSQSQDDSEGLSQEIIAWVADNVSLPRPPPDNNTRQWLNKHDARPQTISACEAAVYL